MFVRCVEIPLRVFFVGALGLTAGCAHREPAKQGLYGAIEIAVKSGGFSRSMKLLTPVQARSPLGVSVKQDTAPSNSEAIELATSRCFLLPNVGSDSLTNIEFNDESAQKLTTMLGVANIAEVGLKFNSAKSFKGSFKQVQFYSGLGVFDENRCGAVDNKEYFVVTGAMSGVLDVSTTAVFEAAPTAKVTIPNTPIDVKVEQSTAKERNIKFTSTAPVFFAAAAGWVRIQRSSTADEAIPLGSSKTVKFPATFAGEVNLKPFDTGNSTVALTISPELSVASEAPPDFKGNTCDLRTEMEMAVDSSCYIWLENAVIILKVFVKDTVPSVRLDAYRTSEVEREAGGPR